MFHCYFFNRNCISLLLANRRLMCCNMAKNIPNLILEPTVIDKEQLNTKYMYFYFLAGDEV